MVGSVSSAIRSWLKAVGLWPSSLHSSGREDRHEHEEQHDREAHHGDLVVAQSVEGDLGGRTAVPLVLHRRGPGARGRSPSVATAVPVLSKPSDMRSPS